MGCSTLAITSDLILPSRSTRRRRTPAKYGSAAKGDRHQQPFIGKYECMSLSGRKRRAHEFAAELRAGLACIYCRAVKSWDLVAASPSGRGPAKRHQGSR